LDGARKRAQETSGPLVSFKGAVEMWKAAVALKVQPDTLDRYHYDLAPAVTAFGSTLVTRISGIDVTRLQTDMVNAGAAAHQVRRTLSRLRQVLKKCVRLGIAHTNVALLVDLPRKAEPEVHPLTEHQVAALLRGVQGHRLEGLFWLALD